jgi:O-antigen/teichoic acid export membrane protein
MASFFVSLWFMRKYPLKRPNWQLFKSYFSFALPVMLLSVISVISLNVDKIMIGYFWTSTEVGYYFSIQQILMMITILHTAISIVLFPTISEYHSTNNFNKINQTAQIAKRYISMVMIPPIVVILLYANPIINIILNSSFLPAASVLIVLTIYSLVIGFTVPYSSLINGLNKPGIAAKIGFAICITNIILNYLFIPRNGLLSPIGINGPTGAAVATLLSGLVGFFGLGLAARRLTAIKILQNYTLYHISAGFIMGITLYFIGFIIPITRWYHIISVAGIGLGVYIIVLVLVKEFKKNDLHFFLDILHPKEMLKYLSSELKK